MFEIIKKELNETKENSKCFKEFSYKINHPKNKNKKIIFIEYLKNEFIFLENFYEEINDFQYLWHFYNNSYEIKKCKYCNENTVKVTIDLKNNLVYSDRCNSNECLQKYKKEIFLEKYGTEHYLKSQNYKEKYKKTCLEKYGTEHYSKTKEYKEKYKETCLEKYGVDNSFKSEEIKNKIKETSTKKYGKEHYLKSDTGKEKYKNALNKKYGVENTFLLEVSKKKIKDKNLEKLKDKLNKKNYIFIDETSENISFICKKCNKKTTIDRHNFNIRYLRNIDVCLNCKPFNDFRSQEEENINEYIKTLGFETINNDRKTLHGKEIDILLKDKNIGFEYNGLYWHSTLNKKYHQTKKILAFNNNINLIQIWEDDWKYKTDIIKSKIKVSLNIINNKIYARNCKIKEISASETKDFLIENHLQGNINSKFKLGLFFNDNLVSVMTFGREKNNEIELLRFCNKLNTIVVGGFSKLLKYFIYNLSNNIKKIISYGDLDWLNIENNVYNKNNFKTIKITEPSYFWITNGLRYNRQNFQKYKLIKQGFDKNKTENEIMLNRGYLKIFNTGNMKFIYEIENKIKNK